jgi:hypothetical protein
VHHTHARTHTDTRVQKTRATHTHACPAGTPSGNGQASLPAPRGDPPSPGPCRQPRCRSAARLANSRRPHLSFRRLLRPRPDFCSQRLQARARLLPLIDAPRCCFFFWWHAASRLIPTTHHHHRPNQPPAWARPQCHMHHMR